MVLKSNNKREMDLLLPDNLYQQSYKTPYEWQNEVPYQGYFTSGNYELAPYTKSQSDEGEWILTKLLEDMNLISKQRLYNSTTGNHGPHGTGLPEIRAINPQEYNFFFPRNQNGQIVKSILILATLWYIFK